MKKFIYILLLISVSALTITSCTEEDVTPNSELNGGGTGSDPK